MDFLTKGQREGAKEVEELRQGGRKTERREEEGVEGQRGRERWRERNEMRGGGGLVGEGRKRIFFPRNNQSPEP